LAPWISTPSKPAALAFCAPADVAVTNSGPASSVAEGGNVVFTLIVKNNGPNSASGVGLFDTLGTNLKYVSATTSQGSSNQSNNVVTFTIGTISNGGTVTITITAQALEDGTLTNSATVSTTSNDSTPGNNSAVGSATVTEPSIIVSAPITTTSRNPNNLAVATFTHASGLEPTSAFKATINWGDGQTSTGTITLSGTIYHVAGSHRYSGFGFGSHKITTTVTEIGQAAQLLLAKKGDEVPGPLDRATTSNGGGRFPLDNQSNQLAQAIADWLAESPNQGAAPAVAGIDGASGEPTWQTVPQSLTELISSGILDGHMSEFWALLASLGAQAPSSTKVEAVSAFINGLG